jgi:succinoglycan biosynthesis transport protein ExoP
VANVDAERFDLRTHLRTVARHRNLILIVTAGVVACAVLVSLLQTTVYSASAEIVLQPRSTESVFDASGGSGTQSDRTVETEIRVLKSDAVRSAVRQSIGSAPTVTATRIGETEAMKITATNTSAERSARIANAYANAYLDLRKNQAVGDLRAASDQIKSKIDALQIQIDDLDRRLLQATPADRPAVEATIGPRYNNLLAEQGLLAQKLNSLQVDATLKSGGAQLVRAATVPNSPASPKPVRNALGALLVGLVLGTGFAFVRDHLDDSVRTKEDLARALPGTPILGVVPVIENLKADNAPPHLKAVGTGTTPAGEAYRSIRTAVQLLGVERPLRTLQITSPAAGEGKTTLLANLAVVLAAAGQRVVMVDCDLRRPTLNQLFDLPNDVGFTSVFLGDASPLATVQRVGVDSSLFLVSSGPLPVNPSEILGSNRTAQFVFELQSAFDVVLVDSAPVLPVADAVVLAAWVEATILVASAGVTTGRAVADSVERLRQVDARVVGTVLNRAAAEATYGYGYGYSTPATNGRRNPTRRPRHRPGHPDARR